MSIDHTDPRCVHALERLTRELTAWLTTVSPSGQPQPIKWGF